MVQMLEARSPIISLSIYTKLVIVLSFLRVIGGWMEERGLRLAVAREKATESHFQSMLLLIL